MFSAEWALYCSVSSTIVDAQPLGDLKKQENDALVPFPPQFHTYAECNSSLVGGGVNILALQHRDVDLDTSRSDLGCNFIRNLWRMRLYGAGSMGTEHGQQIISLSNSRGQNLAKFPIWCCQLVFVSMYSDSKLLRDNCITEKPLIAK